MYDTPLPPPIQISASPLTRPKKRRLSALWVLGVILGLILVAISAVFISQRTGVIPSVESRAVQQWWKNEFGDGAAHLRILAIKTRGLPKDFMIQDLPSSGFRPCPDDSKSMCVPIRTSSKNAFGLTVESDHLYVILDGKVTKVYWAYKRVK